jgi:ABC-type uncharacterized transport system YnjBCD permease subunit
MSGRTYLGFLPWAVFAIVGRAMGEGVAWGGVAALATAVVITITSARAGSVHPLEVAAIVLFTGFAIVGALNQHDPRGVVQHYARAFSASSLALITLISLRYTPFTEPYAREIVLRRFWNTPRFKRVNIELTAIWATVFVAVAASYATGALLDSRLAGTTFGWILPVGLVLIGVQQSSRRWTEQFDPDAMSLDAMLGQVEFWDPSPAAGADGSVF